MFFTSINMIRNYILTTVRNLIRNKVFALVNITGFAIGIACVILFFLWVSDEVSYDRFHENGDRIFNLVSVFPLDDMHSMSVTPFPLAPALKDRYPEVESYTRYWQFPAMVQYGEISFVDEKIHLVDPGFLEMFSFPVISGDPCDAFSGKSAIAITESVADRYFGTEDPIGRILTLNKELKLSVVAVLKNPPENTFFDFSMLASMNHESEYRLNEDWSFAGPSYIMLRKGASQEDFQDKVKQVYREEDPEAEVDLLIQPLKEMHLYRDGKANRIVLVSLFSGIAVIILLLACINYMNLSTACSLKRAREIGLRKINGARRGQVITQFIGESMFYSLLSLFLALILVELVRPLFNSLTLKQLEIHYNDPRLLTGLLAIYLFTTLVSGLYPAFVLSSFPPVRVLGASTVWRGGKRFLNGLVILQFTISMALISASVTINRQVRYINRKDLGLNKENVLVLPFGLDLIPQYDMLREEIMSYPDVIDVSASYDLPFNLFSGVNIRWEGAPDDDVLPVSYNMVDYDFIETMGIEIVEGRAFSRDYSGDDSLAYIINETARKRMGVERASGLGIDFEHPHIPEYLRKGTIIGVVRDFNIRPLKEEITPLVLRIYRPFYRHLYVRYRGGDPSGLITYLEEMQAKLYPGLPFQFSFLEEEAEQMYDVEFRTGRIIRYFTLVSILISFLGLFGMVVFELELRTREIAIRKVLNSSINQIIILVFNRYLKWIVLAFFIATPVSFYVTSTWLQAFAFRIRISPVTYFLTLAGILFIGFLVIGFQSRRSAMTNPAQILKFE